MNNYALGKWKGHNIENRGKEFDFPPACSCGSGVTDTRGGWGGGCSVSVDWRTKSDAQPALEVPCCGVVLGARSNSKSNPKDIRHSFVKQQF